MISIKERTKTFALDIINLVQVVPYSISTSIICKQLVRSATSVGSNYRSALRGRSKAEFIAKLGIAREEADESIYWLDLLFNIQNTPKDKIEILQKEANEITAILTSSSKTAQSKREQ